MKIKSKKLLSLLLALVLALSLSVTAFAAIPAGGSINVTVEFYEGSEYLMEWPTTMTSENATSSYEIPTPGTNEYLNPGIVLNANRPSAMDATLVALSEIFEEKQEIGGWDRKYHENTGLTEILGGYEDNIFDMTTVTTSYVVPTPEHAGSWSGNAWLYKVVDADGNVVIDPGPTFIDGVYATNVVLEEGMTITWTYTYNMTVAIPYEG